MSRKFREVEEIARGSQGRIALAEDLDHGGLIVLKRYFEGLAPSPEWLNLMLATLKRLKHPNVLTPREVLNLDGEVVLVLPLIRGGTLNSRLERQGALSFQEGGVLLAQLVSLLNGLKYLGIVHRDFKPDNLLLQADLRLAVADFDLAWLGGTFWQWLTLPMRRRTLGTAWYMAPEHLKGARPHSGMDLYAVATLYYQSQTLRLPFGMNLEDRFDLKKFQPADRLTRTQNQALREALHPNPRKRLRSIEELYHRIYAY